MHDRKGTLLNVGDRVFLPGVLKEITGTQPTYCNVTFLPDESMAPEVPPNGMALSARMLEAFGVVIVGPPEELAAAEAALATLQSYVEQRQGKHDPNFQPHDSHAALQSLAALLKVVREPTEVNAPIVWRTGLRDEDDGGRELSPPEVCQVIEKLQQALNAATADRDKFRDAAAAMVLAPAEAQFRTGRQIALDGNEVSPLDNPNVRAGFHSVKDEQAKPPSTQPEPLA